MSTLVSRNPATGKPIGEVQRTSPEEIPALVARARAAQPAWAQLGVAGRAQRLLPAAARIAEQADRLAELLTREMGKPRKAAKAEILSCADLARELQEMTEALEPEPVRSDRVHSTIYRDPFGVCAAITPWNFPFAMPHWMVLPALMAGNTVVFKPSEETPLVGQAYADLVRELVPEHVLQVVHGADDQGKALVASEVDLIAFTGSREVGKHILAAAAPRLTRVVLELGGKDPLIVLDDADIARAAKFACTNSFSNSGQVCVSTERIYVQQAVATEFIDGLVANAAKLTVGDGSEEGIRMGPMISERQRDHVLGQIDDAVARGAKIAYGGQAHHGNFLPPTVLTEVTHDMRIAVEETFGPVACVIVVADEQAAIARANDTQFGLGAVVFGEPDRAERVARQLTAGMIGINKGCGGATGTPWVGARQSGYGYHSSRDGHRQFAQVRVVSRPA